MVAILLVLVYGLPGAGKTSLVREILREIVEKYEHEVAEGGKGPDFGALTGHHVCFDELLISAASRGSGPLRWDYSTRSVWKNTRTMMLLRVKELAGAADPATRTVIFVDDNFQLKSMRKHVFRLARDSAYMFSSESAWNAA